MVPSTALASTAGHARLHEPVSTLTAFPEKDLTDVLVLTPHAVNPRAPIEEGGVLTL